MEHLKVELTEEVIGNYKKLSALLKESKPKKFDMSTYAKTFEEGYSYEAGVELEPWEVYKNQGCDTAGCALGWAVFYGIGVVGGDWGWGSYYTANFAGEGEYVGRYYDDPTFVWCFDPLWEGVDNTPQGAAARIDYMLEHGIPWDYVRQSNGNNTYVFHRDVSVWEEEQEVE